MLSESSTHHPPPLFFQSPLLNIYKIDELLSISNYNFSFQKP